jgi:hypothetical protein
MIGRIDYDECRRDYPSFPLVDNQKEIFLFPKVFRTRILYISSKTAKGHAQNLSKELGRLFSLIGAENIIFLGESRRAWRYQDNPYPPVQEALQYLAQNKVLKKFDGALDVSKNDWSSFFKHLFWLVRCNAALPTFYFVDNQQTILGSLCQYGNFHLSTLTAEAENRFLQVIDKTSFSELIGEKCFSSFSKSNKIANRTTLIQ